LRFRKVSRPSIGVLPGEIPTAEPANIRRDLSVVDNLAVAASRLLEQDAQIKTLQSEVNTITHPPNAFYVDTAIVATALGSVQRTDKTLRVQLWLRVKTVGFYYEPPGVIGSSGSFGCQGTGR
jgi:hypothetical protein